MDGLSIAWLTIPIGHGLAGFAECSLGSKIRQNGCNNLFSLLTLNCLTVDLISLDQRVPIAAARVMEN